MAASVVKPTREFAFIAFENVSGKVMAHGACAIDALSHADRLGPNIEIEILAAGQAGDWIWNQNFLLAEARSALSERDCEQGWPHAPQTRYRAAMSAKVTRINIVPLDKVSTSNGSSLQRISDFKRPKTRAS